MAGGVMIRELDRGDVEAVVAISLVAWAPLYEWRRRMMGDDLFKALHPDWRKSKAAEIRGSCDPGGGMRASVAEKEGQVVGFVTFLADEATGVGVIGSNAVHPDFQRLGIGSRLHAHAIERLKALGMRYVKVGTGGDPAHLAARNAYEKAGFTVKIPTVYYYRKL